MPFWQQKETAIKEGGLPLTPQLSKWLVEEFFLQTGKPSPDKKIKFANYDTTTHLRNAIGENDFNQIVAQFSSHLIPKIEMVFPKLDERNKIIETTQNPKTGFVDISLPHFIEHLYYLSTTLEGSLDSGEDQIQSLQTTRYIETLQEKIIREGESEKPIGLNIS